MARLVVSHREQVQTSYDEPLVKILDEAAYDPAFRRSWMRPLLARLEELPY